MSTTGPDVIARCRAILREDTIGRHVFETSELREAINRAVPVIGRTLGLGTAWVRPLITLAHGTLDYTLPGGDEYNLIQGLFYADDNVPLPIRSLEVVLDRRAVSIAEGRPSYCALRPDVDGTVELLTNTNPLVAEGVDALLSLVPATWEASDATAPTIPFSTTAARALELRVCASVVATAGGEKLNALALGDGAVARWDAEAAELLRLEKGAIITMKRSRSPHSVAWFSQWVHS